MVFIRFSALHGTACNIQALYNGELCPCGRLCLNKTLKRFVVLIYKGVSKSIYSISNKCGSTSNGPNVSCGFLRWVSSCHSILWTLSDFIYKVCCHYKTVSEVGVLNIFYSCSPKLTSRLSKLTKHFHKNNSSFQYERQCTRLLFSTSRSIHLRTIYLEWWNAESTRVYTVLRSGLRVL